MRTIGIDIGGVIKSKGVPLPGAIEGVKALRNRCHVLYVVSRIDDMSEAERSVNFFRSYGLLEAIPEENIFFCFQRPEKAPIAERLKITYFIDDRPEVLSYMKTVPNKYAFNPTPEQLAAFPIEKLKVVANWEELLKCI